MAKYLIASIALVALVSADGGSHDAGGHDAGAYAAPSGGGAYASPSGGYGAPAASYQEPSYQEPAYAPAEYAAPDYAAPTYEADAGAVAGGDLFDLSKILELLPLFLAVFAAIIVAQLLGPLLGMLFGAKLGLAGGLLNPLADIKIDLINTVLAGFGLSLCNIGPPLAVAGTPVAGRSLVNADTIDMVARFVGEAFDSESILPPS